MTWYLGILGPLAPTIAVVVGRWLSNREHRSTERQVQDIYLIVNSERDQLLEKIAALEEPEKHPT
jgi:hypothetical protein